MGWVSFLNDVSSECVYPLLPLFVVGTLAAPAAALGLIEGAAQVTVSLMNVVSGWHSDRIRRRLPYVCGGYALSALAKPLLAVATVWPTVLAWRLLDRFGKGVRSTARDALIADLVPSEQRGEGFGFHRAMDTAGAVVGVLAALAWVQFHPGDYRQAFWLAVVPGLLAFLLTLTLREARSGPSLSTSEGSHPNLDLPQADAPSPDIRPTHACDPSTALSPTNSEPTTPAGALPAAYWRAAAVLVLLSAANSSDTFILLRAHQLGLSDVWAIAAYAFYNLSLALTAYPAGRWSDGRDRWMVLAAGWALYVLVYAGLALATPLLLWGLLFLYGVHIGLTDGVSRALLVDLVPGGRRGTALGTFALLAGAGSLAGNLAAGWLWDHRGPAATFWLGSGLALIGLTLIPWARRRS